MGVCEDASEEGIDPEMRALRRFDKKRPGRRTSNEEWKNPHDPQAKVGRTKDGACDMIYKPEHVTDLESGAIVQVEVLEGDHADTKALSERSPARWKWSTALWPTSRMGRALAHRRQRLLCHRGNRSDPRVRHAHGHRGCQCYSAPQGSFERPTAPSSSSCCPCRQEPVCKALLRKRGMHLERGFEHILDQGGLRRATLKGTENLTKRYKIAAACFNLSLLMRTLLELGPQNNGWQGPIAHLRPLLLTFTGVLSFRALCVRTTTFILVFPNLFRTRVAA